MTKSLTIEVPAKEGRAARIAEVELRFSEVEIMRPARAKEVVGDSVLLTAIWLKEPHPPKGVEGLRWMLLSNLPVQSSEEAETCIKWYQLRWQIEIYHKIWKSGCRIEACRLETAARLIRYITLMSLIAWRIFWMTHMNRRAGNLPCTTILAEHEWRILYYKINKTNILPKESPTISEAMRWIARLGGFLARKHGT